MPEYHRGPHTLFVLLGVWVGSRLPWRWLARKEPKMPEHDSSTKNAEETSTITEVRLEITAGEQDLGTPM